MPRQAIDFELGITADGILLNGEALPLPSALVPRAKIGAGANGFVVRCWNPVLNRDEAVKFWLKLREGDMRDKLAQGLEEARKAAAISSARIAHIYGAGTVLGKYFYAAMEYCEGEPLRDFLVPLEDKPSAAFDPFPAYQYRYNIAVQYLTVIEELAEHGLLHGDAHPGNVIVKAPPMQRPVRVWPPPLSLKLLDFGTSLFSKKTNFIDRHWRTVDETMDLILGKYPTYEQTKQSFEKPPRSQPDYLMDFYKRALLALSYEFGNSDNPLPHRRPIKAQPWRSG